MKQDAELLKTEEGRALAHWIGDQLASLEESTGDYCVDNYRWYQEGDPDGFMEYGDQEDGGCCGSAESEAIYPPTGIKYFFGLNYGH